MQKKVTLTAVMLFMALLAFAQPSLPSAEIRSEKFRREIDIDYAMTDFNTSKVDGEIIGIRLAKMLHLLQRNYKSQVYASYLSAVMGEHINWLRFASIDKLFISNISKHGDIITIRMRGKLGKNPAGIKSTELELTFDEGVSESLYVNELFSYLGRYIRE